MITQRDFTTVIEVALDRLDQLAVSDPLYGPNVDNIATWLTTNGCHGEPMNCHTCPVAIHLTNVLEEYIAEQEEEREWSFYVEVLDDCVRAVFDRHEPPLQRIVIDEVMLPESVTAFIVDFDVNDYPNLVAQA